MAFFEPDVCGERCNELGLGGLQVWQQVDEAALCDRFVRLARFIQDQYRATSVACQATCYLMGPLGAGKSTAARALIRALGVDGPIKSPTYALLEPYEVSLSPENADEGDKPDNPFFIGHWDLYRLADPDEIEHLGFRDYLANPGLQVIEWPQQGAGYLPWPDLAFDIQLSACNDGANASATPKTTPATTPATTPVATPTANYMATPSEPLVHFRDVRAYAFTSFGRDCLSAMTADVVD